MLEGLPGPGEVIAGKYRVDRVLGIGGMGVVFEAFHLGLGQRVAIKCLGGDAAEDEARVKRFQREAWTAAKIQNEHIVRVTDVGQLDTGGAFMVMEYLEGEDLEAVGRRDRLSVATAVDYVLQAAEAMAEAHKAGIIHRDLKPGNLFLSRRGDGSPLIKVLDFGISKVNEGALTSTRSLMGSPLYMAPEQLRSAKYVDPRSDIWSLGVILYEMVTGTTPYAGDTLPEICTKILHDPPTPISHHGASLPAGLDAVIARWLQKDPGDRFQNLAQVANAVAPFGSESAKASAAFIRKVLGDDAGEETMPLATQPTVPVAQVQPQVPTQPSPGYADDEVTKLRQMTPFAEGQVPMRQTQPSQPQLAPPAVGSATQPQVVAYPHQQQQPVDVRPRVGSGTVPSSPDLLNRIGVTTAGPVSHSSIPEVSRSRTGLILGGVAAVAGLILVIVIVSLAGGDGDTAREPAAASDDEKEAPVTDVEDTPEPSAAPSETAASPTPEPSAEPSAKPTAKPKADTAPKLPPRRRLRRGRRRPNPYGKR